MEWGCARCGAGLRTDRRDGGGRLNWSAAFALAALVLYPAAIALPVLELSKLGHVRSVTVWSGSVDLMAEGELLVGLLVFACSIVVPVVKLLGILMLGVHRIWDGVWGEEGRAARARVHAFVEWVGRWSMLDVLLVAILVAAIKLGNWADIHPGPGVFAFAAVVVLSLLASAVFDPHEIWEERA
jgi:paraquat-inducible protein A